MNWIDWIVLGSALAFIVIYGMWKSRGSKDMNSYHLASQSMPWYAVGLSIMATQASAITFLSAPGQAFTDGMRFVQFYFGLPLAMIVLSVTFVPIFHRLKIFTAYEYLEGRFDLKTRSLTALLFLTQRGLAAGLTIYAPSIILSSLLGWNIYLTNVIIGGLVVLYTVSGGSKAVSYTQLGQMSIIFVGMLLAGYMVVHLLPENIGFTDAVKVAGKMGKMNILDTSFDLNNKYNMWTGLLGGFFLALSYFGTDQSQVGRYLAAKSVGQSRLGLLFNGMVKIPMQFFILLIGALLFTFHLLMAPPIFFNKVETDKLKRSEYADQFSTLEERHAELSASQKVKTLDLVNAMKVEDESNVNSLSAELLQGEKVRQDIREQSRKMMKANDPLSDTNDTNYIFLSFVLNYLPHGLIGLLIAVIFSASMSSTSSELNALSSTTVVDIYKRSFKKTGTEESYLRASKNITVIWGVYAIGVAMFASQLGSLIEAVNVLGSLFYGTILGIFLAGFYFKRIQGGRIFYAALISEAVVISCYAFDVMAFLWLNVLGCFLTIGIALLLGNTKEKF